MSRSCKRTPNCFGLIVRAAELNLIFGASVAVASIVGNQVAAYRFHGGTLLINTNRCVDIQTPRVGFIAEDVINQHTGEFGGIVSGDYI